MNPPTDVTHALFVFLGNGQNHTATSSIVFTDESGGERAEFSGT